MVAGHIFRGPYALTCYLENSAGVFLVLCQADGGWRIVNCGEAERIREYLEAHPQAGAWRRDAAVFAVWYNVGGNKEEQSMLVKEIKSWRESRKAISLATRR